MSSLKNAHAFIYTVMFSAKLHVHEARLEPRTFLPVRYLCVATVMSELLEPHHFFFYFIFFFNKAPGRFILSHTNFS